MYFIRFLIRPKRNNSEYGKIIGAYANCWIKSAELVQAKKRARDYLEHWKWRVVKIDDVLKTRLKDNIGSKDDLKYYREAKETGICVVLHKWPTHSVPKTSIKKRATT